MRRKNKLTCFFITVSLTLLNVMSSDVYASSNPSCSIRVLASLLFPNLSASLHPELADYISLQPPDLDKKILRQAFLRASRIQAPPVRQSGEYNFEEAARPTSFQSEITVGSKESPILAKKVGNRSMVFEIQTVEGKRFIRPLGRFGSRYGGGPRLTVAASRLNLLMQLGSVPQARFAQTFLKIRPESEYPSGLLTDLAAVSEEVVSQSGKDDIDRHEFGHYPAEYINAHPYPEKSWDALAFEFLIGNRDVNGSNVRFTSQGMKVIDHGDAFSPYIGYFSYPLPQGLIFPRKISQSFVHSLEELSPAQIEQAMNGLLTSLEIKGVLFRREILLQFARLASTKG